MKKKKKTDDIGGKGKEYLNEEPKNKKFGTKRNIEFKSLKSKSIFLR